MLVAFDAVAVDSAERFHHLAFELHKRRHSLGPDLVSCIRVCNVRARKQDPRNSSCHRACDGTLGAANMEARIRATRDEDLEVRGAGDDSLEDPLLPSACNA